MKGRHSALRAFTAVFILVSSGCQTPPPAAPDALFQPAATVKRSDTLLIAETYLRHRWKAEPRHRQHGPDARGIQVDTPDIGFKPAGISPGWWRTGAMNVGVPYCWGGFDTPASFDAGLKAGKWAGDIYTSQKRALLDDAVSQQTAGIDCSGFISRCWRLDHSYSTREIPSICEPLAQWEDLQPGDALNVVNAHVLLFAGFQDRSKKEVLVYETGCPPIWKVMRHPISIAWLKSLGYTPWRYKGIVDG